MKGTFAFLIFILGVCTVHAQYTAIPDIEFEQYLVDEGIDTDGEVNGQVLTADIADETDLNLVILPDIQDLTGIQDFTNLENLQIWRVNITELDLSQNLQLKDIGLEDVSLTSLDLSNNLALETLIVHVNDEGHSFQCSIDQLNLHSNNQLDYLIYDGLEVTDLDLSNASNLRHLTLWDVPMLEQLNIKNQNNSNIEVVGVFDAPNLACIQVDDPEAVIAGTDPPYNNWMIYNLSIVSDDCYLLSNVDIQLGTITIWPNPVSRTLHFSSEIPVQSIILGDVTGRVYRIYEAPSGSLDLSFLSPGAYILKLVHDKGQFTQKVIKL